jgi:folate-binding protein YgfZ
MGEAVVFDEAAWRDGYHQLRTAWGALWLPRDVVLAEGPGALDYLQGQLSQDIAAIPVGGSAWSFVLQPQGKVDALLRVSRADEARFVLDTDAGWGERLLERLNRFKLRAKIELTVTAWRCLALRGPRAADAADAAGVAGPAGAAGGGDDLAVDAGWPGLPGVDLLGPEPAWPDGVAAVPLAAWEVARIEAGVPVMGRELTEATIPAEAGIVERTVSFTKGCYTGQELVARIDSRGGHVPRHLRGVVIPAAVDREGPPPAGTALLRDGQPAGVVTSAARHPDGHTVALAYVKRDVEPPAELTLGDGDGGVARIEGLPLVS